MSADRESIRARERERKRRASERAADFNIGERSTGAYSSLLSYGFKGHADVVSVHLAEIREEGERGTWRMGQSGGGYLQYRVETGWCFQVALQSDNEPISNRLVR